MEELVKLELEEEATQIHFLLMQEKIGTRKPLGDFFSTSDSSSKLSFDEFWHMQKRHSTLENDDILD